MDKKISLARKLIQLKESGDTDDFLIQIKDTFPNCLSVCVNYDCNLRCLHCDVPRNENCPQNPELIKAADWKTIINNFAARGGKIVSIIYREPLYDKESREKVYAILQEAKKQNIRCGLVNNGSFFDEFIKQCPDVKMDFIDFSIEGPEAIHENIRIGSSYDTLKKAICSCKQNGIAKDIFLATTINKLNYQRIAGLVEEFKPLGVNHIFHTWMPTDQQFDSLYLPEEIYIKEILPFLAELSKSTTVLLDVSPVSFRHFSEFWDHIFPKSKFYMEDTYIYAKYGNLHIRFININQSLLEIMVVSPEGKLISMEERYLTKKSPSRKNAPDILDVLDSKSHPNIEVLREKLENMPRKCFGKECFLLCLGQNKFCSN